ncbi:MAG: hypothetical protein K5644_04735 [Lachnospiraceae bacterium]|nr:hypothetical protein [Lachnospiraceae bacterium]
MMIPLPRRMQGELLESRKCQMLLDAADEIDLSDTRVFQTQFSELL